MAGRVELRTMEVMLTDFEKAAFTCVCWSVMSSYSVLQSRTVYSNVEGRREYETSRETECSVRTEVLVYKLWDPKY